MEEDSFQEDLRSLKQRVSELSIRYSLPQPSMTFREDKSTKDPFGEQLSDVLKRLHAVEQSMKTKKAKPSPTWGNDALTSQSRPSTIPGSSSVDPLGPNFWQMHNMLNERQTTFARSLESRLEMQMNDFAERLDGLEEAWSSRADKLTSFLSEQLNELDDRLESIDPNRFTPATSTAGSEHCTEHPSPPTTLPYSEASTSAPVCELYTDAKQVYVQPCRHDETFATPISGRGSLPPPGRFNPSLIQPTPRQGETFVSNCCESKLRSNIEHLSQQNDAISQQMSTLDRANEEMLQRIQSMGQRLQHAQLFCGPNKYDPQSLPKHGSNQFNASPEGVDFRDREISRLDEQLRIAHETLRITEESLKQRDEQIEEFRKNAETTEREISAACHVSREKEEEMDELRRQVVHYKNAALEWERTSRERAQDLCSFSSEAHKVKHTLQEKTEQHQVEVNKMKEAHEKKMQELNKFCEEKDGVIQKQQKNILWAAGKQIDA
jgi:hypothetical protein